MRTQSVMWHKPVYLITQWRNEGRKAADDGLNRGSNPYGYSTNIQDPYWIWDEGWLQTDAEWKAKHA